MLDKLFGRSPFQALQEHMDRVAECVEAVVEAFAAMRQGDQARVEQLSREISKREHKADLVKNDLRNHLPRGLFLPVDRANLLEILGVQDTIADQAEDLGIVLTLKPLQVPPFLDDTFAQFLDKNIEAFAAVCQIIAELDELLASSFGGTEAEKVKSMVDQVAFVEHEVDLIQRELLKTLMAHEDDLSKGEFYLWMQLFQGIAELSNLSEKLANRIRMTLERK